MPRTVTTSVSVLKSTANSNGAGRQDVRKGQGDLQNRGLKTSSSVVVPEDHFSLIRGSGHRLGHENRVEMSASRRSNSRDKGGKNGSRGSSSRKNEEETKRSDRTDRRHHQQRNYQQSSSNGAQNSNQTGNEEDSTQRPPLIEYFKNNGVDLKRIYKRTKIQLVVNEQAGLRSQVYLAGLSYPEGYGSDDLPDSQDFLSQSTEEPLSPAVLLAANNRRREVLISSPSISSDDIIRNLRMGRNSNNGNPAPPAVEPRTPENDPEQPANASINGSFPDDSFNDSMIIMASQQVEDCLAAEAAEQKGDKRKRDFNGNNAGPAASPDIFETSAAPITSTPLTSVTMSQRRTSQTCSPRCRRVGLSRNRNKSGTPKSLFENSLESPSPIKRLNEHVDNNSDEIEEQQRKILKLDESPIKPVDQHGGVSAAISGEFEDDDNDDFFSQIPDEDMLPPPNTKNKIRNSQPSKVDKSNKTDDWIEDSLDNMNESELAALEKFEAMHCNSTGSSNSSSNATPHADKPILRSSVGHQTPVTSTKPTPKPRRMGLTKSRSKK